jgi:hypothetical protein
MVRGAALAARPRGCDAVRMNLPLRIQDEPGTERVISVDGAFGAPGLNLSHWPGNATPRELKHDLSTGIALEFARLPSGRRAELTAGCVAIANNHFDTDGASAIFAVLHPGPALERTRLLLDVAAAGDFFQMPSEHALKVDLIVEGLVDAERSPWKSTFAGLSDSQRGEHVLRELMPRLSGILDGDVDPYADLWAGELEIARADLADLALAARDEVTHLDLAVWTAPERRSSSRSRQTAHHFDPGRHALFGSTRADRVLVIGPQGAGATYRFVLSTLSWFDLVSRKMQPRPDLARLAARLNELEGSTPGEACAWRAQDTHSPSPELWFGRADHQRFAEHAPALEPSRLPAATVRRAIADALRASWEFPED